MSKLFIVLLDDDPSDDKRVCATLQTEDTSDAITVQALTENLSGACKRFDKPTIHEFGARTRRTFWDAAEYVFANWGAQSLGGDSQLCVYADHLTDLEGHQRQAYSDLESLDRSRTYEVSFNGQGHASARLVASCDFAGTDKTEEDLEGKLNAVSLTSTFEEEQDLLEEIEKEFPEEFSMTVGEIALEQLSVLDGYTARQDCWVACPGLTLVMAGTARARDMTPAENAILEEEDRAQTLNECP